MERGPDWHVLAEFAAEPAPARRLDGGQGRTWIVGDLVLKPVDDEAEAEWVAGVLCDLIQRDFRLSRPVRARTGRWTASGWSAWRRVDGRPDLTRWRDVVAVAESLHEALRLVPRPDFLDARGGIWVDGERAAWDDGPPTVVHPELAPTAQAYAAFRKPSRTRDQIIHGDLAGNVLFADPLLPAIIDFTPYWRPTGFASAVVVADAIAWHDAPADLTEVLSRDDDPRSMLARAGLFRLITSDRAALRLVADNPRYLHENLAAHSRVLEAIRSM